MNKKAVFMTTFALVVLFVMAYAGYVFIARNPDIDQSLKLGENQIAISNAYKNAENDLFYNSQAVKFSINKASEIFSINGGVDASCNKNWKLGTSKCNPDLEKNFENILKKELKYYDLDLINLSFDQKNIKVILKNKFYETKNKGFEFNYTVEQIFKQETPIDFYRLINLRNEFINCDRTKKSSTCTKENSILKANLIYFTIENHKSIISLSPVLGFKELKFEFNIGEDNRGEVTF